MLQLQKKWAFFVPNTAVLLLRHFTITTKYHSIKSTTDYQCQLWDATAIWKIHIKITGEWKYEWYKNTVTAIGLFNPTAQRGESRRSNERRLVRVGMWYHFKNTGQQCGPMGTAAVTRCNHFTVSQAVQEVFSTMEMIIQDSINQNILDFLLYIVQDIHILYYRFYCVQALLPVCL